MSGFIAIRILLGVAKLNNSKNFGSTIKIIGVVFNCRSNLKNGIVLWVNISTLQGGHDV